MQAECTQCGLKFSGLTDFDAHRPGKPGAKRPCLDPSATEGWGATDRGVWMRPGFKDRQEAAKDYFSTLPKE